MRNKTNRGFRKLLRRGTANRPKSEKQKSPWSSLEIAKILMSSLVPLAIAGAGISINQGVRSVEERREKEALVTDFRAAILDRHWSFFLYDQVLSEAAPGAEAMSMQQYKESVQRGYVLYYEANRAWQKALLKYRERIESDVVGERNHELFQGYLKRMLEVQTEYSECLSEGESLSSREATRHEVSACGLHHLIRSSACVRSIGVLLQSALREPNKQLEHPLVFDIRDSDQCVEPPNDD